MLLPDWAVLNAAIDWLGHGLWNLSWWQVVLYTLFTTHITIAAVTIFLHRAQAHRSVEPGGGARISFASGCGWAPAW